MIREKTTFIDADDEEEPGFFRKYRIPLGVLLALAVGGVSLAMQITRGKSSPPRKAQEISMVKLLPLPPLPPPPPPPPEQQTIKQPDMVEQTPMNEPESKPKAPDEKPAPPKAADQPEPLGTNIKGDGAPDGFNLGGSGGTGGFGSGRAGGAGSRYGWYAGQVQAKIAEALRNDPRTRAAAMRLEVRIWPDLTGRVTRAQLQGSTGDSAVDEEIKNQILTGMQLQEPPPEGMPTPIVLRLTALRPN